jgi:hypothetical protein
MTIDPLYQIRISNTLDSYQELYLRSQPRLLSSSSQIQKTRTRLLIRALFGKARYFSARDIIDSTD